MKGFFSSIGKGILYFLTPFAWIVGIAVGGVIALVVFLGYSIYCIFLFFTGRNLFKDLPEDEKAKEILAAQQQAAAAPAPQPVQQAQTQVFMQSPQVNLYQNPGYPYPGQPQQPWQQPMPTQEAHPQMVQQEPVQIQEQPMVEPEPQPEPAPIEEEFEEPIMEQQDTIEEQSGFEQPEFEADEISPSFEEDEIEEYIPSGGDVYDKDIKGDYDD